MKISILIATICAGLLLASGAVYAQEQQEQQQEVKQEAVQCDGSIVNKTGHFLWIKVTGGNDVQLPSGEGVNCKNIADLAGLKLTGLTTAAVIVRAGSEDEDAKRRPKIVDLTGNSVHTFVIDESTGALSEQ